jgi:hypothetical protein
MDTPVKVYLPKAPDQDCIKLLSRARLLMEHAFSHVDQNSDLDNLIAIHGMDNSIEYILRIIIKHLDIESITKKNLESSELAALAGEINKFLQNNCDGALPYLADIKLIRQIRNLVQHGMVNPQPDIERWKNVTERFFDKALGEIFGLKRQDLRISTLINDGLLKEFIKDAEQLIDQNKYLKSIIACRDAFENAVYLLTKNSNIRLSAAPALIESKKRTYTPIVFL